MLCRVLRVVPVARRVLVNSAPSVTAVANRFSHHGPPANYKYPTMDDVPAPCGCWQEDYDNKQRKYNLHLLLGIGVFIITLAVGKASGVFEFYFLPPDRPLDRKDMNLSCD